MSEKTPRAWKPEEIRALGVRTDVPTAGEIIAGLCRDESYRAVKRGDFPVPVIKVGRRLVVPVAPIMELLRIGPPDTDTAGPASPDPAATSIISAALPLGTTNDDPTSGPRHPTAPAHTRCRTA